MLVPLDIKFEVHKPSTRYIDEFIASKCSPDLILLKLFPNSKEITESFAAYRAVREHLRANFSDPSYTLIAVGDGHTPRTAATFAFRSRWNCISVDPNLKSTERWISINRLTCYQNRIEDLKFEFDKIIVVAVHSHAPLHFVLDSCRAKESLSIISIPCCTKQDIPDETPMEYPDYGIWSEKKTVKIWKELNAKNSLCG